MGISQQAETQPVALYFFEPNAPHFFSSMGVPLLFALDAKGRGGGGFVRLDPASRPRGSPTGAELKRTVKENTSAPAEMAAHIWIHLWSIRDLSVGLASGVPGDVSLDPGTNALRIPHPSKWPLAHKPSPKDRSLNRGKSVIPLGCE